MEDCLPTVRDAYKKWILASTSKIGEESSIGKIYQVCTSDDIKPGNCSYVMKILTPRETDIKNTSKDLKDHEVQMQTKCADMGLCLPVEDEWDCNNGETAVIITKMARETLFRYIENKLDTKEYEDILDRIKQAFLLIRDLHRIGISHGDTHLNNFMLTFDNTLKMIDLGLAKKFKSIGDMWYDIYLDYSFFINSIEYRFDIHNKNKFMVSLCEILSKLSKIFIKNLRECGESIENFDIIEEIDPDMDIISYDMTLADINFEMKTLALFKEITTSQFNSFFFSIESIFINKILDITLENVYNYTL